MDQLWRSLIPYHVARDFCAHPGRSPIGREKRFSAVVLFADVSGFTAIGEALGRTGRQGAEELTAILNNYFTTIIDLSQAYGGIVGKFGGDAVTVFFPYTAHTRQAVTRRALQCALDMQNDMEQFHAIATSAGTFGLAMKAGLASGPLYCTTAGDPDIRLEFIIAGSILEESAAAEHHAARGEVIVANRLLASAGQAVIYETRGNFTSLARLRRRAATAPLPELPPLPRKSYPFVSRYIHPAIATRVQRQQTGFLGEHRQVTILFGSFSGFDYDDDAEVGAKLQGYLARVIQIVQRYDGYLNKVDMGDKGSKFIVLFGAPIAFEDNEERALRCALELRDLPGGPTIQIGVNSGYVYCGLVGSPVRQEYTVMGDAVNVAARLMQAAAPGQILSGAATWEAAGDRFTAVSSSSLRFKGKTEPYNVFTVAGPRRQSPAVYQGIDYDLPLVGREEELKKARDLILAARHGGGQVVGITAQAGVGKSRLGHEIAHHAARQGFAIFAGSAESYGTTTHYLIWRAIWRTFFDISETAVPGEQIKRLSATLTRIDPRLNERLPLLGPLLNLTIPDNDLTRTLEPQMRVDLLRTLLLECLRRQSQQRPILLLLEDCHWMDDLSRELLAFIGRNLAEHPVIIVALYRPRDNGGAPLAWAAQADPVTEITLHALQPTLAEELARLKLQRLGYKVPADDAAMLQPIITRAQGNPFFLEEMINYLHDSQIPLDDENALSGLEIPNNLQNLIISRIDRLPEAIKTTLKVASVIGRVFPESWIRGTYQQAGSPEEVRQQLAELRRLDLTRFYQPGSEEPTYIFKHITTQEVAYESLAFSTRARLHEQVGRFIEGEHGRHLTQYVDVLAHHYGRSHNTDKQRYYFREAGDMARQAYANQAAIDYYTRLLPLLEEAEQAPVRYSLGQVRQHIGQWQDAEVLFREALITAQKAQHMTRILRTRRILRIRAANAALALGGLLFLSRPEAGDEALHLLEQARDLYEQSDDEQGIGRVLERLSFIYSQQGDYEKALDFANQQVTIARRHDDPIGASSALNFIGDVHLLQGDLTRAEETLQQALAVARDAGHKRGIILASNDLAGVYWHTGNYHQSLAYLQQSLSLSQAIGDEEGSEVSIGNAGLLYHQLGQETEAIACFVQALSIAVTVNDWASITHLLGNLGEVLARSGHSEPAAALTDRAIELSRSLNIPHMLAVFLLQKARLLAEAGHFAEALAANEEALQLAGRLQYAETQFEAELLAVNVRRGLREIDAESAHNALGQLAANWPEDAQQAAIAYEISRLAPSKENRQKAAGLYRDLYEAAPEAIYRRRYQTLTGELLPATKPLPPPAQVVQSQRISIADLFRRAGVNYRWQDQGARDNPLHPYE